MGIVPEALLRQRQWHKRDVSFFGSRKWGDVCAGRMRVKDSTEALRTRPRHTESTNDGIAALLTDIDLPWCHPELASALAAPPSSARAYLVEALRRSTGDLASTRALRADLRPPRLAPLLR